MSKSFFGVVPQGPLSPGDFRRMQGVVGTLRVPVPWSQIESRPGRYAFSDLDGVVARAAERGIRILPFVYGSPDWLAGDWARPPHATARGRAPWSEFLRLLVRRYGPGGALWQDLERRLPIRHWQIWNEPNFLLFWRPRPSPRGYARLLSVSARAIRGADPGARIVAAGVAPVEAGMLPWEFLRRMYLVPGVGHDFDVAAVHPYSSTVAGVEYQVRRVRRSMAWGGDGAKPLRVTELGVASDGLFSNPFDKGPLGQARFMKTSYRLLLERRRRWHISGVDWFAWRDLAAHDSNCVFCQYSGLFDIEGRAKPAWHALQRVSAGAIREPLR